MRRTTGGQDTKLATLRSVGAGAFERRLVTLQQIIDPNDQPGRIRAAELEPR